MTIRKRLIYNDKECGALQKIPLGSILKHTNTLPLLLSPSIPTLVDVVVPALVVVVALSYPPFDYRFEEISDPFPWS